MNLSRFFRRRPRFSERSLPNRSGCEIFRLRDYFGHELHCTVSIHGDEQILIAPMLGCGGLYAEQDPVELLVEPVEDAALGEKVCDGLFRFEARDVPPMAGRKKSDWPSYRKSGARSMKAFERRLTWVRIQTRNGELIFDAYPALTNHPGVSVNGMLAISASHAEIGALLRRVVRGVTAMRRDGVI